jgi:predicted nucleic acid-binding protein
LSFAAGDELLAPALLLSECTSILHEQAQTHAITRDLARHLVQTLLRLPIHIADRDEIYLRAFEIAGELNWEKAYDGIYVAVAELEGGELLTLDGDMHRGALRLSVPSTLMR